MNRSKLEIELEMLKELSMKDNSIESFRKEWFEKWENMHPELKHLLNIENLSEETMMLIEYYSSLNPNKNFDAWLNSRKQDYLPQFLKDIIEDEKRK